MSHRLTQTRTANTWRICVNLCPSWLNSSLVLACVVAFKRRKYIMGTMTKPDSKSPCAISCFFRILLFLALLIPAVSLAGGERLQSQIAEITQASEFKQAHWGILVVDLAGGDAVYELSPDHLFAPASVTKLFSTAAALDALGAEFRFETPVFRRGEVDAAGALNGDLILVASGDLTLGGRTKADGTIAFTDNDHTYANGGEKGELTE